MLLPPAMPISCTCGTRASSDFRQEPFPLARGFRRLPDGTSILTIQGWDDGCVEYRVQEDIRCQRFPIGPCLVASALTISVSNICWSTSASFFMYRQPLPVECLPSIASRALASSDPVSPYRTVAALRGEKAITGISPSRPLSYL